MEIGTNLCIMGQARFLYNGLPVASRRSIYGLGRLRDQVFDVLVFQGFVAVFRRGNLHAAIGSEA
jgi:hypothetical protein